MMPVGSVVLAATIALGETAVLSPVSAQDAPPPSRPIEKSKYSPYPEKTFPNRVYFGDTHCTPRTPTLA